MGALGPEQRKEPRYQVTYHTYLASGRQLSYTPSIERVVGLKYVKRSLLVVQNFAIFRLRHTHVRKDTRLSTAFPYCKRQKAGRGLGTRLDEGMLRQKDIIRFICGKSIVVFHCSAYLLQDLQSAAGNAANHSCLPN